jgi:TPR repeat protein
LPEKQETERMRRILLISAMALILVGCQTEGNIRYNIAAEAQKKENFGTSFSQYLHLAKDDNYNLQASAQFAVSNHYFKGKGTPKNIDKGLYWLKKVANNNDPKEKNLVQLAQGSLGLHYEMGIPGHVDPDANVAVQWYSKAKANGSETAPKALARLLEDPAVYTTFYPEQFSPRLQPSPGELEDVKSMRALNPGKAFKIVDWHARKGSPTAQRYLTFHYLEGVGVKVDKKKAMQWLYLSAKNGSRVAQYHLANEYYKAKNVPGSFDKTYFWLRKSAKLNYHRALNDLGLYYIHPLKDGISPDLPSAFRMFTKAASLGSVAALVNLGDMHKNGESVPKNIERAIEYYQRAAELDHSLAKQRLAVISADKKTIIVREKTIVREIVKAEATPDAEDLFPKLSASVFKIHIVGAKDKPTKAEKFKIVGSGSGVAVTKTFALTNCHVAERGKQFVVKYRGNINALLVTRRFDKQDICIVKAKGFEFSPIASNKPLEDLKIGQKVFAIGSPQGLENTISEGIISGFRKFDGGTRIQITAPITHGSSGGGLFDADGALIGITTSGLKGGGELNFAVPSYEYVGVAKKMRK